MSQVFCFKDQFDNYSHGALGPTDEAIIQGNSMFFDFGAGLYWKARLSDRLLMQAGFSAWHIHKPTEFFIAESHMPSYLYVTRQI